MISRRTFSIALAGVVILGLATPASALAETGNQAFTEFIQGTLIDGHPRPTRTVVVAHGVVNAVGTDEFVPSQPGDPDNVDRGIFTFPQGTLSILVTSETFTGGPTDPRTCVARFSQSGTWDIVGGTGAFAGATGSLTFAFRGTGVAERLPGGACSNNGNFVIVDRAVGEITVPSR